MCIKQEYNNAKTENNHSPSKGILSFMSIKHLVQYSHFAWLQLTAFLSNKFFMMYSVQIYNTNIKPKRGFYIYIYICVTVHNDTCRSPFIFGWHTSLEKAQLSVELNYTRTPTEDASWLENREKCANIFIRMLHLCQCLCNIFLALDWSSSRHRHFGSLFIDEEQKNAVRWCRWYLFHTCHCQPHSWCHQHPLCKGCLYLFQSSCLLKKAGLFQTGRRDQNKHLTPSLPQQVKFLGWKIHGHACKQYVFRSYNIYFQCYAL